jgi:hypothetical protein
VIPNRFLQTANVGQRLRAAARESCECAAALAGPGQENDVAKAFDLIDGVESGALMSGGFFCVR